MSIISTLENEGHLALSWTQRAAAWLVGELAKGRTGLSELEAASPAVQLAINAGITWATAHGFPVTAVETAAEDVLRAATEFVNGLTEPPVVATPVPSIPPVPAATVAGAAS